MMTWQQALYLLVAAVGRRIECMVKDHTPRWFHGTVMICTRCGCQVRNVAPWDVGR